MDINIPEQLLESLERDLKLVEDQLKIMALTVIENEVSPYPIFIAHRESFLNLGKSVILAGEESGLDWNINLSILGEFVHKKIISESRIQHFINSYKEVNRHACVFVLSGKSDAGFVYYPYTV